MKIALTLTAVAATVAAVPAFADAREGLYARSHEVTFLGDFSARECREAEGRWVNGLCTVPVSDIVLVEKASPTSWAVRVDTITTNGRNCELKGTASADGQHLVAVSGAGEGCRLRLSFPGEGKVSVRRLEESACSELCASSHGLDIEEARRVRR